MMGVFEMEIGQNDAILCAVPGSRGAKRAVPSCSTPTARQALGAVPHQESMACQDGLSRCATRVHPSPDGVENDNTPNPKLELDLSVVKCSAARYARSNTDLLSSNMANLGHIKGRYESEFREEEVIGKGGFGVVHRAMHYLSDGARAPACPAPNPFATYLRRFEICFP